jgi:5'(3')-deoxyribonucleotidase
MKILSLFSNANSIKTAGLSLSFPISVYCIHIRSIDWPQLSRFHLNTETESSLQNVVFCNINRTLLLDKDMMMDVKKHNIELFFSLFVLLTAHWGLLSE